MSGFSCLSCIELSSVLALCLYVTFLLNLSGNITLSDFVLKVFTISQFIMPACENHSTLFLGIFSKSYFIFYCPVIPKIEIDHPAQKIK